VRDHRPFVRILTIEQFPRVLADELDQRRDAQRLTDVVHVHDEHRDADEDEHECCHDRDPWNVARAIAVVGHLADREDRMHKSGDEEADRELARLVLEDALHDPQ
jgi:hypothetical protein